VSRAYRLRVGEPVPEEIARVARGRIDHAIDELSGATESTSEQAVHNARKDMKKLRALLRLVRGEIGDEVVRRERAAFRDVQGELSGRRDADVMLATLESLDLPAKEAGPVRQALEAHRLRMSAGSHEDAIEMLTSARARVVDWPLGSDGFAAFEDGLRWIYRRGRRAYRRALAEPTDENLHEWRKRVKDLWYALSLLGESWKPVMDALADEAHELSDRVGDDHDLAVLSAWSDEPALEEPIARRRAELQEQAFAYGARLYADRTGAFVSRLESWWQASVVSPPAPRRAA
jgi:CHAD domain-containing protein